MKTLQETFDFVCSNLINQGRPSVNSRTGACVYRSKDGAKCAAGWCIPDKKYRSEMDFMNESDIENVVRRFGKNVLDGHDLKLLVFLQNAHDVAGWDCDFLSTFRTHARAVAANFGLNTKVLESGGSK